MAYYPPQDPAAAAAGSPYAAPAYGAAPPASYYPPAAYSYAPYSDPNELRTLFITGEAANLPALDL